MWFRESGYLPEKVFLQMQQRFNAQQKLKRQRQLEQEKSNGKQ